MMKRMLTALCLLSVAAVAQATPPLSVEDPWVRESPPGTEVNGAYLALRNDGDEDVKLVRVGSPHFSRVEMHETVGEDERSRMRRVEDITVPAGESVALEPGGLHLMLFTPRRSLEAGEHVTLTLEFDNGQLLEVGAPVRKRTGREDDDAEGGHAHGRHH
jgi:periplasmic copper chaperone A